ncbi:MAG: methyltransferase domain-containing protein [Bacteroidia bacterium]
MNAQDHTVSGEQFGIWECDICSLRFTQDVPTEKEIGAYYRAESYISHTNTRKGIVSQLYQFVRRITLRQKRRLVEGIVGNQPGRLLDIGCGTGDFLGEMKRHGWQVQGLEPDAGAAEQARTRFAISVGEPDDLFSLEGSFTVVSMWHVLEHVHRLHAYLDRIGEVLDRAGVFLVAVPNYQSFDADRYTTHWAAYDVPRHLYHFTPHAMRHLLDAHGFEVTAIRAMPFDAFYVSLLSEKYRTGRLRLLAGFWTGLRSWLQARHRADRASAVLYIVRHKAS